MKQVSEEGESEEWADEASSEDSQDRENHPMCAQIPSFINVHANIHLRIYGKHAHLPVCNSIYLP